MGSPTTLLLEPELKALIAQRSFRQVRDALANLEPADIADLVDSLDHDEAIIAFRVLPRQLAADAFAELSAEQQEHLLEELGDERAAKLIESMDPDDRAAVLDELPVEVASQLIGRFSPLNRKITQAILGYHAESVGRIMTPDYVRVRSDWSVARALDHIRRYGHDAETIHWVYVADKDGTLIDDIHIRKLLLADTDALISDLMDNEFLALRADDDREEAVRKMARYDRTALPVIDSLGLLVGIVTVDDIADVAEAEFTEDVHKLGGMSALDMPYMSTGTVEMLRKRGVWLAMLFIMQVGTIGVISRFEETLEKAVVLALFIPLVISCGGNTGSQAATMLVRALSVGDISTSDWWRVARKELVTGIGLGSLLGMLGFLTVAVASQLGFVQTDAPIRVGFAIGTAVVMIVTWATLIGSLLPILMVRIKIDPATSSTPLIATLMDVSGLLIYFTTAVVLLTGTVL
ncbi:MAG: magnesium transporter [Phycisphaerales bacterium]|nr:magnesium transporter [Planctomycetota bacterium]MCH8509734.1 magnesium transporter [Phycisphaerales bacterium]